MTKSFSRLFSRLFLSPYGGSPEGRQAPTEKQKSFRLLLTAATAQIIQNSLKLLGIKTLERM